MTTTFTTTEPGSARSRRRMAEAMLAQGIGGEPIQHWTQGIANMAKAAIGGYQLNQLDSEERAALSVLRDAPGLGSDMSAPAAQLPVTPAEEPRPPRQQPNAATRI